MGWIESNTSMDPMAKEGMRIRMLHMDDQYGVDEGMEGTIIKIDDLGTLHVRWDDGSQLGVIPKLDKYQLLPSSEEQVDLDFFSEADFKLSSASKKNKMGKKTNLNFKRSLSKTNPRVKDIKVETDKKESKPIQENKVSLKDEVQIILNTIKTAKPIHRESLDNMVNNLVNKYKGVKKNEEKFNLLIEKLRTKINDKFGLEETTTASSAGAYNAPLFGKQTTVKKPKTQNPTTKIVTKGTISNPSGKLYSLKKESKKIKGGDLLDEISSTHASKLRSAGGPFDGDSWAGNKKDGWKRRSELAWKGGEIADILAKLNINWSDSDLSLSDKHVKKINEEKKKKETTIHTKKWERCVKDVEKKNKENKTDYNPYAVCQKSIGYEGSIKKPHRIKNKKEIEETTTFSSVFGGNFPVTPFMFAKKGKHIPSKKTLWPGGKIIQKVDKADLLGESLLDEINKIKWVKGGKFVKIKDRCAKYNNKSWCSQGALDNPLELSDTVFENIKKISKKTGLTEEYIYHKIMDYFSK